MIKFLLYIIYKFYWVSTNLHLISVVENDLDKERETIADKTANIATTVLNHVGFSPSRADIWNRLLIFAVILIVAFLFHIFLDKVVVKVIHVMLKNLKLPWENYLYDHKLLNHIFELLPPFLVQALLPIAFTPEYKTLLSVFYKVISIYIVIIFAHIIISLIHSLFNYHLMKHHTFTSPYKGVVEMSKLVIICLSILVCISILVNIHVTNVITYISAFTAVLVLVFKDTLLGFVAGIQLAQNQMIKIGDWITVDGTSASGTIVDITILTVKIQNFDNTFVFVPAYNLIQNSFQNWAGMYQSGARRMDKAIYIDINTIAETTPDLIEKIKACDYVKKYISDDDYKQYLEFITNGSEAVSTNLGLFRIWIAMMFKADPAITNNFYQIVEDNPCLGCGLPLNMMFFVNTTDWVTYEAEQSRIFERLMKMMPYFNLKQFQFQSMVEQSNK